MAFDINFQEKATVQFHIKSFLLYPSFWENTVNHVSIPLTWNLCRFEASNHSTIPREKGIYCFVVKPNVPHFFETSYLLYIGKTNRTLYDRYKEYLNDQSGKGKPRSKVYEMLKIYRDHIYFYYAEIPSQQNVDNCEERFLNIFFPPINTLIPIAKIKPELQNIYE